MTDAELDRIYDVHFSCPMTKWAMDIAARGVRPLPPSYHPGAVSYFARMRKVYGSDERLMGLVDDAERDLALRAPAVPEATEDPAALCATPGCGHRRDEHHGQCSVVGQARTTGLGWYCFCRAFSEPPAVPTPTEDEPATCQTCRHAEHDAYRCLNMASDNDCSCDLAPSAVPVTERPELDAIEADLNKRTPAIDLVDRNHARTLLAYTRTLEAERDNWRQWCESARALSMEWESAFAEGEARIEKALAALEKPLDPAQVVDTHQGRALWKAACGEVARRILRGEDQ